MIPSQFYPTYQTWDGIEKTDTVNYLNIINPDFTNAYWLGWIKDENIPISWHTFKYHHDDEKIYFERSDYVENHNIGYTIGGWTNNFGMPAGWVFNRNEVPNYDKRWYDVTSYLTHSLPNKMDIKQCSIGNTVIILFFWVDKNRYYTAMQKTFNIKDILNPDFEFSLNTSGLNTTFKISDFLETGYVEDTFNGVDGIVFIGSYTILSQQTISKNLSSVNSEFTITPFIDFNTDNGKSIAYGLNSLYASGYNFVIIGRSDYKIYTVIRAYFNVNNDIENEDYFGGLDAEFLKSDIASASKDYFIDKNTILFYQSQSNIVALALQPIKSIIKHIGLLRSNTSSALKYGYDDGVIYFPEILHDGEFTGNMITGTEDDLSDKLPDWIKEGDNTLNEYTEDDKPSPEPEPEPDLPEETGDRILNQFSRTIGVSSNFITTYIMNDAQISELGKILWTSWTDDTVTMDMVQNFYGLLQETTGSWDISSVMNFIVNCKIFPFSLPTLLTTTPTRNLYIGTGKFAIQCSTGVDFFIASSPTAVLNAGSVTVPRLYNDFRDYENTNITVYLPFCGNLELNPADVVGKQITCTYVIDLFSGACTAYLYTSDDVGILYNVAIQKGKCGFSVPITATNAGQISTMLTVDGLKDAQGIAGMLGTAVNTGLGVLNTGSASGLLGGANSFISQGFGLEIMQQERMGRSGISCRSLSGGSNFGDFMCPSTAYIQIRRAMYSLPAQYDSTVGYTTHAKRYGRVSNFNGFIQCVNADVSGLSITEEEKNEIKSLLESGIYVN